MNESVVQQVDIKFNVGGEVKLKSTKLDDVYHHGDQNGTNITNVRHLFITL